MKLLFDPSHLEMPFSLATCIIGSVTSLRGIIGVTLVGWWVQFATIDPQKLAIQPLREALTGFIIAWKLLVGCSAAAVFQSCSPHSAAWFIAARRDRGRPADDACLTLCPLL